MTNMKSKIILILSFFISCFFINRTRLMHVQLSTTRFECTNVRFSIRANEHIICKRRLTFFDVVRLRTRHIRDSATRNEQQR